MASDVSKNETVSQTPETRESTSTLHPSFGRGIYNSTLRLPQPKTRARNLIDEQPESVIRNRIITELEAINNAFRKLKVSLDYVTEGLEAPSSSCTFIDELDCHKRDLQGFSEVIEKLTQCLKESFPDDDTIKAGTSLESAKVEMLKKLDLAGKYPNHNPRIVKLNLWKTWSKDVKGPLSTMNIALREWVECKHGRTRADKEIACLLEGLNNKEFSFQRAVHCVENKYNKIQEFGAIDNNVSGDSKCMSLDISGSLKQLEVAITDGYH